MDKSSPTCLVKLDTFTPSVVTQAELVAAPMSSLERLMLAVERHINGRDRNRDHPAWGEDIKVMGVRRGVAAVRGALAHAREGVARLVALNTYPRLPRCEGASSIRRPAGSAVAPQLGEPSPATVPLGWKTLLRIHHRNIGFDRIGNEAILVGSMVHLIKFFRTWYTIPAPRKLRA